MLSKNNSKLSYLSIGSTEQYSGEEIAENDGSLTWLAVVDWSTLLVLEAAPWI